jgi:predicted ATP-dependent serine protease
MRDGKRKGLERKASWAGRRKMLVEIRELKAGSSAKREEKATKGPRAAPLVEFLWL